VCSLCIVALQITISRAFMVTMSLASVRSTHLSRKFSDILSDCNQILIVLMDFNKSPTIKSHENLSNGRQADTCGET